MPNSLWRREDQTYHGLSMRCAPGTHETAIGLLRKMKLKPAPAVDLASGSGAFLARLGDAGFTDLSAVELDAGKFKVPGITPLGIDLNGDFAAKIGRRFSLVSAIEIIEHLDSPRHFLMQARELLNEDGVLLLSTPNVSEWVGRIKFFLTGTLRYFDEGQYQYNHHVSPVPDLQLRHLVAEVGLRVIDSTTAGGFMGWLKLACFAPVWLPMRIAMGPRVMGDVNLYVMGRSEAAVKRAEDWTS